MHKIIQHTAKIFFVFFLLSTVTLDAINRTAYQISAANHQISAKKGKREAIKILEHEYLPAVFGVALAAGLLIKIRQESTAFSLLAMMNDFFKKTKGNRPTANE